jgi:hypothetical protein
MEWQSFQNDMSVGHLFDPNYIMDFSTFYALHGLVSLPQVF